MPDNHLAAAGASAGTPPEDDYILETATLFGRDVPTTRTGAEAAVIFAQRLHPHPDELTKVLARLGVTDGLSVTALLAYLQNERWVANPREIQQAVTDEILARCQAAISGESLPDFVLMAGAGRGKTYSLATVTQQLIEAGATPAPLDARSQPNQSVVYDFTIATPTHKACAVVRQQLLAHGIAGVGVFTARQLMQQLVWGDDHTAADEWLAKLVEETETTLHVSGLVDPALAARSPRFAEYVAEQAPQRVAGARAVRLQAGTEAALQFLGIDPFQMFSAFWLPRTKRFAQLLLVDEATMLAEADLIEARGVAKSWVFFGDELQLAPILDRQQQADQTLETPSVISHVPWDRIRSLRHNFRAAVGAHQFLLADFTVEHGRSFREVTDGARALATLSDHLSIAAAYDASIVAQSPVLVWRNKNRIAAALGWRDFMDFPRDALVPGEPLLLTQVPERIRDAYDGRLTKNTLVRAGVSADGRTRLILADGSVTEALPLWVGFNNVPMLQQAGVPLLGDEVWHGVVLQNGPAVVMAEPGGAITVHRSQGSEWPVVQLDWMDFAAFARSSFGAVQNETLPGLRAWQRLVYVALTRASRQVRIFGLTRGTIGAWANRPVTIKADLPTEALELIGATREVVAETAPVPRTPSRFFQGR